jgi:hypothetical protein
MDGFRLRQVGSQLSDLFSDFDVRSYGHSKLSDLVRKTEAFDIEKGDGGPRIRARAAGSGFKKQGEGAPAAGSGTRSRKQPHAK